MDKDVLVHEMTGRFQELYGQALDGQWIAASGTTTGKREDAPDAQNPRPRPVWRAFGSWVDRK